MSNIELAVSGPWDGDGAGVAVPVGSGLAAEVAAGVASPAVGVAGTLSEGPEQPENATPINAISMSAIIQCFCLNLFHLKYGYMLPDKNNKLLLKPYVKLTARMKIDILFKPGK
ncbi:hypothetical protein CUJ83_06095 [Methanocella sp. CWC-04]|uniref:Uncharacterized protein n=1 Tax=Methanooceanicella nereidis TaxID=2052831 RepID=A0AAP2RE96_9EURY|nr:hypothetical protein [Methanocella sp. CWC-04]